MAVPVTKLTRFSDPAATATVWEETRSVLEAAELFWLSTVRTDGRPHVTPVVAAWADGAIWFSTGVGEQKFVNLQANPHVVMTTGCNGWEGGMDVVLEGKAVQVTDDAVLGRVAQAFAGKFATAPSATRTAAARHWCSAWRRSRSSRTQRATRSARPGTGSERRRIRGQSPGGWGLSPLRADYQVPGTGYAPKGV